MAAEAQRATCSREHPGFAYAWLAAWHDLDGRVMHSPRGQSLSYPIANPTNGTASEGSVIGLPLPAAEHRQVARRVLMALLDAAGRDARAAVFALASDAEG